MDRDEAEMVLKRAVINGIGVAKEMAARVQRKGMSEPKGVILANMSSIIFFHYYLSSNSSDGAGLKKAVQEIKKVFNDLSEVIEEFADEMDKKGINFLDDNQG